MKNREPVNEGMSQLTGSPFPVPVSRFSILFVSV